MKLYFEEIPSFDYGHFWTIFATFENSKFSDGVFDALRKIHFKESQHLVL